MISINVSICVYMIGKLLIFAQKKQMRYKGARFERDYQVIYTIKRGATMKKYDLSQLMKSAHRTYRYMGKKQGRTFGQVLKTTWHLAKLQLNFSEEAVRARREKVFNERVALLAKAAKATPSEEYNNPDIPSSAYYNPYSTHRRGAHYVGD